MTDFSDFTDALGAAVFFRGTGLDMALFLIFSSLPLPVALAAILPDARAAGLATALGLAAGLLDL
ncbi:MAG: hypothetical protein Q7T39_08620 [Polaromonas sp.]|nr:hypothetical protein [Polaromonas sp.]